MSSTTNEHKNMICIDCVHMVLSNFLHCTETMLINQTYAALSRSKLYNAAVVIQRWYRSRKLHGDSPYEKVTLKTLKRFYVTKYEEDWLKNFPQGAVYKLGLDTRDLADKYINPTPKMQEAFVRTFYQFCEDFKITHEDLFYYGW